MKTNIKMRVTPEQSEKVQKICFDNGISWSSNQNIRNIKSRFIYIDNNYLWHSFSGDEYSNKEVNDYICFFYNQPEEEVDADLFIRTNGTCEEKISEKIMKENIENLETFIKKNNCENISDLKRIIVLTANKHDILERKLKKKNEILKKARIKRKNQREELHRLNLKLQKCISFEEHNRKIESIEFDLNMFKSSNKLREDLIEKLERDAKESIKDIKELESLNNVLKMENKSLKESSKISCNMLHGQKDKIYRLELNYVTEQSRYKKEIEKLKAVIEYLESKVK